MKDWLINRSGTYIHNVINNAVVLFLSLDLPSGKMGLLFNCHIVVLFDYVTCTAADAVASVLHLLNCLLLKILITFEHQVKE